ncbi:MAG: restriction endonuclease [Spirochaetota bacterium]|nr:restriction endonuclease [Spirochaetota bacterium]
MPIPDYQTIMKPLLEYVKDGKTYTLKETYEKIADHFYLTEEEKNKLLSSGKKMIYKDRTSWAKTYMKKAGLLEDVKWGHFKITQKGKDLLSENPDKINDDLLMRYEDFRDFKKPNKAEKLNDVNDVEIDEITEKTPEETLDYSIQKINENVLDDLLETVKSCSPLFFERLVIELLVKMGYGGSMKEAGEVLGKSGDEGIDGIIKEDRLGLDVIYVQAKRWSDKTITSSDIDQFVGALTKKGALKGVFITTSSFTRNAIDNIKENKGLQKVILIDGKKLVELMFEHNLGVDIANTYQIKKIDTDYFDED